VEEEKGVQGAGTAVTEIERMWNSEKKQQAGRRQESVEQIEQYRNHVTLFSLTLSLGTCTTYEL
jgi:hypothetical protein